MVKKLKYSQKKAETIVEIFKHLGTITMACKSVGINRLTYYNWMNSIPEFKEMVDEAQVEIAEDMKMKAIASIKNAFDKHWYSAAWWLERSYPDQYAKREFVDNKTNMSISQVKINYIEPKDEVNKIEPTIQDNTISIPTISLNIEDVKKQDEK